MECARFFQSRNFTFIFRNLLTDLSKLINAAKGIEWPKKVDYDVVDADIRLPFEIAFLNLLRLQEQ
jgi:hypothetical protein